MLYTTVLAELISSSLLTPWIEFGKVLQKKIQHWRKCDMSETEFAKWLLTQR